MALVILMIIRINKNSIKLCVPQCQRDQTSKKRKNKTKCQEKKILTSYKNKNESVRHCSARKRLKLSKTSLSENRNSSKTKHRKNYYYYNKPDDIFNDKPMSRTSSKKRLSSICTKKKRRERAKQRRDQQRDRDSKRKKKSRKQHKQDIVKATHKPHSLSTRLSNKNEDDDDDSQCVIAWDEEEDKMHFLDYDDNITPSASPIEDLGDELNDLIAELRADVRSMEEDRIDDNEGTELMKLPILPLTESLSDNVQTLKVNGKNKKKRRSMKRKISKEKSNQKHNRLNIINDEKSLNEHRKEIELEIEVVIMIMIMIVLMIVEDERTGTASDHHAQNHQEVFLHPNPVPPLLHDQAGNIEKRMEKRIAPNQDQNHQTNANQSNFIQMSGPDLIVEHGQNHKIVNQIQIHYQYQMQVL